jgi:hypothetical protein
MTHSLPDKVEAAYRRGDLLEKRILLMQVWADYCTLTTPGSIPASTVPQPGVSQARLYSLIFHEELSIFYRYNYFLKNRSMHPDAGNLCHLLADGKNSWQWWRLA